MRSIFNLSSAFYHLLSKPISQGVSRGDLLTLLKEVRYNSEALIATVQQEQGNLKKKLRAYTSGQIPFK